VYEGVVARVLTEVGRAVEVREERGCVGLNRIIGVKPKNWSKLSHLSTETEMRTIVVYTAGS